MEISTESAIKDALGQAQGLEKTEENTEDKSSSNTDSLDSAAQDFSNFLTQALGRSGQETVSEEELFAGAIAQQLNEKDPEAAEYFLSEKTKLMTSMARADGYVSVEEVANKALANTVEAEKISQENAESIKSYAFQSAQLDDNLAALYDDRGSASDPTIATSTFDVAVQSMRAIMQQIDNGELSADPISLDEGATGGGTAPGVDPGTAPDGTQELDGSGGFLWKPVSESDGNLVVLLPTTLKGLIDKVEIHSELPASETSLIEKGRFTGDTHNGGRAHFRFDQPGEAYGENIHLVVFKDGGETVSWNIGNGGNRHD